MASLLAICAGGEASVAHAAEDPTSFSIPAGEFSQTILQFSEQAQVEVLYASAGSVKGIRTPAVVGRFDKRAALRKLLEGTGFKFSFETDRSVLVGRASDGTDSRDVYSDTDGDPTVLTVASATDISVPASEVTVTGSHLHGVLDIMSPLRMVTQAEMEQAPYATVQDALQALPTNVLSSQSDDFGGIGNFNRGSALNLRGLGYGATLVLVDGYRQPASGTSGDFVDTSNIPFSAVDHIEVLPDGASALYGSDAIAGVVNVIMRSHLEGAETKFRTGATSAGASETLLAQLFGRNWGSGHALLAYQFSHRTTLAASDRAYSANADKSPFGGRDFRTLLSNPGNILDPTTYEPLKALPPDQDGRSLAAADLLSGMNRQNQFQDYDLVPDRRMHSAYLSGLQKLGERTELFMEGRYTRRESKYRTFPHEEALNVPNTNAFYVDAYGANGDVTVGYNFLDDFGPVRNVAVTSSYVGTLGLRKSLGQNWRTRFSGSYGQESLQFRAENIPDPLELFNALADSDRNTAFNPFGDGSQTNPETLEKIRSFQEEGSKSSIATLRGVADGTLFTLPNGPAKLAVGLEFREERLTNDTAFPKRFERSVGAAFAELALPLIGPAGDESASPRLNLSLAGRFERYRDFGQTFNPRIGLRWVPAQWLKLRSSWGTAFKAPRLIDLFNTSENGAVIVPFPVPDPLSPTGTSTIGAIQGTNPNLKEETATTWTAGIDLAPQSLHGMTMSLTYFSVNYKNQVIQPGPPAPSDILLQESLWSSVISRNPSPAEVASLCDRPDFFGDLASCYRSEPAAIVDIRLRNLANTKTSGLDLTVERFTETHFGQFRLGLEATYVLQFERLLTSTSPSIDVLGSVSNPLALRGRGVVEWSRGGYGASASVRYSGRSHDPESQLRRSVDDLITLDLRFRYEIAREDRWLGHTGLSLNAVNVTNKAPPFVDRNVGFDRLNARPYGRVLSIQIDKKW